MRSCQLRTLVVLGLVEHVLARLSPSGRTWLATPGLEVRLTPEGEREDVLDTPDGSGAALLWAVGGRALVWTDDLEALRAPSRIVGTPRAAGARVFRAWTRGRQPRGAHDLELALPRRWSLLGEGLEIAYKSSKFNKQGRLVRFVHEHEGGVKLWGGAHRGAQIFALQGASLRITRAGIEG